MSVAYARTPKGNLYFAVVQIANRSEIHHDFDLVYYPDSSRPTRIRIPCRSNPGSVQYFLVPVGPSCPTTESKVALIATPIIDHVLDSKLVPRCAEEVRVMEGDRATWDFSGKSDSEAQSDAGALFPPLINLDPTRDCTDGTYLRTYYTNATNFADGLVDFTVSTDFFGEVRVEDQEPRAQGSSGASHLEFSIQTASNVGEVQKYEYRLRDEGGYTATQGPFNWPPSDC